MLTSRWTRGDTNLLTVLLGLAFAVEAVIGVLIPALHVVGLFTAQSSRDVGVSGLETALAEAGGLKLSAAESATLTVADPDLGQRILLDLPGLFDAVPILLGIYWLFLVARTLRAGDPFAPRNPRRVFGIAVLIAVGSLGDSVLTAFTNHLLVAGTPLEDHVPFALQISFLPLGIAAVVAALAEAFRVGVRLRADTEGLV
ncbi:DUF2975 family protein [Kribbella sp. VKM Ac-2569]|uniref:DUF2975 domain-containing protein n=1 Tax=Kribbella sp. VKM Ac-2569 TaxID=2512220 RepID=UPI00102C7CB3|nr:DUF2975 domain-containing protein [Kribbella sp. VKM Ac-2569]RZT15266.1 DUF2975 family protein [Kribbella sp. VKM Ac-2569]